MKKIIKNVRIISPYEVLRDKIVLISNEEIENILDKESIKEIDLKDFEIIDGEDKYLSPGFIDIHNHGNSGYDIMDSSPEALDKMGDFHISNGVTSYLGTVITSSYDNMINAIKNIDEYKNKNDKSHIIGIHLEGPFFNMIKKGAQPDKYIKAPSVEMIHKIIDASKGKLKMVSLAPELEGALDVINDLKEKDIKVAMGHTNSTFEEAKMGIENGATIATHIYNGMRNFNHREPGVVGASLTDERVYCELIYDRFHLHDAATQIALSIKGYNKIVLVSDAMRAAGLKDGEYDLGGQKVTVKDGKPRLESGNIAGSTLNLKRAIFNMINYLQVPINEAVKMASLNPAKAIDVDDKLGSIEIGKKADLLLFDENINIDKIFIGGNLSWKKN
jgi:N-acetylglucosamine-6-phosphate deacetylase